MIIALMAVYLVLLFALVHFGIVRFNLFWRSSPFIVLLLLNLGLFIPMGWGAPQGPGTCRSQCRCDCAERCRRSDGGFGDRQYAA